MSLHTAAMPPSAVPPSSPTPLKHERGGMAACPACAAAPSAQSIAARVEGQGKQALLLSGHAPDGMGFRQRLDLWVRGMAMSVQTMGARTVAMLCSLTARANPALRECQRGGLTLTALAAGQGRWAPLPHHQLQDGPAFRQLLDSLVKG
jgi:hypothetical protein